MFLDYGRANRNYLVGVSDIYLTVNAASIGPLSLIFITYEIKLRNISLQLNQKKENRVSGFKTLSVQRADRSKEKA